MTAAGRVEARATWRWLRRPGLETSALHASDDGWRFTGRIEARFPEGATRLRYEIECDRDWRTRKAHIRMTLGGTRRAVWIVADEAGHWKTGGMDRPELQGCVDLDFAATPVTNTLPIRRLDLPVGGTAEIRAAWVTFPDLITIPTSQRYTRLTEAEYGYESLKDHKLSTQGHFTARFDVDEHGLVRNYPGYWERVPARTRARRGINP